MNLMFNFVTVNVRDIILITIKNIVTPNIKTELNEEEYLIPSCYFQNNQNLENAIRLFEKRQIKIKRLIRSILKSKYSKQLIDLQKCQGNILLTLEDVASLFKIGEFVSNVQIPIEQCQLLNFHQLFMLFSISISNTFQCDPDILLIMNSLIWTTIKPFLKKQVIYRKIEKQYKLINIEIFNLQLNKEDLSQEIVNEFKKLNLFQKVTQIEHYFPYLYLHQYKKFGNQFRIQMRKQLKIIYDQKIDEELQYIIRQEFKKLQPLYRYFDIYKLQQLENLIQNILQQQSEIVKLDSIDTCLKELLRMIQLSINQSKSFQSQKKFKLQSNINHKQQEILDIIYLYLLGTGTYETQNNQINQKEYYSNMRQAIKIVIKQFSYKNISIQKHQVFSILKICENVGQEMFFQQKICIENLNFINVDKCYFKLISNSKKISKTITICISGFTTENSKGKKFQVIDEFDDSIVLFFKWKSGSKSKLLMNFLLKLTGLQEGINILQQIELDKNEKLDKIFNLDKDCQSLIKKYIIEAEFAGKFLSNLIKNNYFKGYILNFVGHALGVQVIQSTIRELDLEKTIKPIKIIDTILMMAGTVEIQTLASNRWNWLAGEIINVYTKKNKILKLFHKTCGLHELPGGIQKIPNKYRIIRNFNLSSIIQGHQCYLDNLQQILVQTDFHNNYRSLYERIDEEFSEQNSNQLLNKLQEFALSKELIK